MAFYAEGRTGVLYTTELNDPSVRLTGMNAPGKYNLLTYTKHGCNVEAK